MPGSGISSSFTFAILSIPSQLKAGALEKWLRWNPSFFKLLSLNFSKIPAKSKTSHFNPIKDVAFSRMLTDGRSKAKRPPLPKYWHTYPTKMKLGTV